jgi:hypothetical protein
VLAYGLIRCIEISIASRYLPSKNILVLLFLLYTLIFIVQKLAFFVFLRLDKLVSYKSFKSRCFPENAYIYSLLSSKSNLLSIVFCFIEQNKIKNFWAIHISHSFWAKNVRLHGILIIYVYTIKYFV